jgi:hypothetical protein
VTNFIRTAAIAAALLSVPIGACAAETEFLQSLDGDWTGTGMIKVRVNTPPVKVSCQFNSDAPVDAYNLEGNCRGLLVFTRAIRANLRVHGETYTGSYIGAGTGTAGLAGSRNGDTVNLGIRWAREVNGDRKAVLRMQKTAGGMTITTIDTDQATGKEVVTSKISLTRP